MGKVGKTILGVAMIVGGIVAGALGQWTLAALLVSDGIGILTTPKIKVPERQGMIMQNRVGTQNGIPVVYGKARIGCVLTDVRVDTASTKRRRLSVVTAWAHGSQDGGSIGGSVNLVANPGGEIGALGAQATSWANASGNGLLVTDDDYKIGSRSMRIVNAVAADSQNGQSIAITAGKLYRISGWIKTGVLPSADAGFGAVIKLTGAHTILNKITTGADPDSTKADIGIAADGALHDWTYVECLFKGASGGGSFTLSCVVGYGGTQSGTAWFDEVHCEAIPMEIWFDDRLAINVDGTVQAGTPGFSTAVAKPDDAFKHLEFLHHLGAATQAVDARMNALYPTAWPATSQGRGVAYSRWEMWYNTDVFPSGVPEMQAIIYGQQVYDPRDKTLKWSDNPALCIRDYLTSPIYGFNIPVTNIDEQSFIDMANYCDEIVSIPGLGSAARYTCNGWVDTNRDVKENILQLCSSCRGQVINQGDRWRLFIRRQRPHSGIQISETNTLEGSWGFVLPGTEIPNVVRATYVDPDQKYQAETTQWPVPGGVLAESYLSQSGLGGYVSANVFDKKVLQTTAWQTDTAVAGAWLQCDFGSGTTRDITTMRIYALGGAYAGTYDIEYSDNGTSWTVASASWTPSTSGWNTRTFASVGFHRFWRLNLKNTPGAGPDLSEWDLISATAPSNTYLASDGGIESRIEIDLPFTTSRARAEQLCMTLLREARKSVVVTTTLAESLLEAQCGDIVGVTYPTPGWAAKEFDVGAMMIQSDGAIQAVLVEYDPTVYDLDPHGITSGDSTMTLPDPFSIASPTSLVLTADSTQFLTMPDGSQIPRIKATWTPPSDAFFKKIEVEARPQAGGDANFVLTAGMLSHSGLSAFTAANCVDGNLTNNAWHTDTAVPGATLQADLGAGNDQEFRVCKIWSLTPGGYAGVYDVEYSDNGSSWSVAYPGFCPSATGLNFVSWTSVGAHRYWRLNLKNTPGSGTWLTELAFTSPQYDQHGMVDEASEQVFYVVPATGPWDVRIRAVNKLGVTSPWVSSSITVGDRTPQILSITLDFTIAGGVTATVQGDSSAGSSAFIGRRDRFPTLAEVQAAVNQQLLNPGFEDGQIYWGDNVASSTSIITDPAKAKSGSKYMQVSAATGLFGGGRQLDGVGAQAYFAVAPGDVIKFGGWIYRESGTSDAYFAMNTYDSGKVFVNTQVSTSVSSSGAWTFVTGSYTVPGSGVAFVSLFTEVNHTGTATVARFDDTLLQKNAIDIPHNGRNASAVVIDHATGVAMVLDDSEICYLTAIDYTQVSLYGSAGPIANGRAAWTYNRRRSIFTASSTFVAPSDWNPNRNLIEGIGAGGSGVDGVINTRGGGGGGGGEYRAVRNVNLVAGTTYSFTVGAGNTTFNTSTLVAVAGATATNQTGGAGGSGGTGAFANFNGAGGGNSALGSIQPGGGGGGAAGPAGAGSGQTAGGPADPWGTGQRAGNGGGAGTPPTPVNAIPGSAYGGGGGGGACTATARSLGASGAGGILVLTWYG